MDFDTLIKHGTVVDGTGQKSYKADVGITAGKIAAIGDLAQASGAYLIDATNHVIAPGFIDMHAHSDVTMLDDPNGESKAYQGVTTEVSGNCGSTPYPAGIFGTGEELRKRQPTHPIPHSPTKWNWHDLDSWATYTEKAGISLNIVPQIGHSSIKKASGASEHRPANRDELKMMKKLTAEAIEQGAVAVTNGLTGAHFSGAPTSEIIELVATASQYKNAFYSTHPRLAGGWHFKAVEEAVHIGKSTGVRVEYSHIAIIDSRHHGKAQEMALIFEAGINDGVDIAFDIYPYLAGAASFKSLTPPWLESTSPDETLKLLSNSATRERAKNQMKEGWWGDMPWHFDKLIVVKVGQNGNREYLGQSLEDIASSRNSNPLDTILDTIIEDPSIESVMHNRSEEDMRYFLAHRLSIIGSDGTAISPDGIWKVTQPHPRIYGCHPRVLGKYVREQGVLSLEDAVYKMTGFPAERIGMKDRGTIKDKHVADIVIFDPENISDVSTYQHPHQYPIGIKHVLVKGESIIKDGTHTGARPGRVLKRGE